MFLRPADLIGKPIRLDAKLLGLHAIMAPPADRVLAVLMTANWKQYTLFIRHSDDDHIELYVEQWPSATGPEETRARIISP